MRIRIVLVWLALCLAPSLRAAEPAPEVTVWKSPYCGCCTKWVDHLRAAGFTVRTVEQVDLEPLKAQLGIPKSLGSCHTAMVGGYVVEGHVPAASIRRLLKERPALVGLSVPGMPPGSPGMESPDPQSYNVVSFDERGRMRVFDKY